MKQWLKDNRGFLVFVLCLGVFRTAVADWNPIPSGSMRPTLLEGDVVLVDRLAYDLKLPLADQALLRLAEPATRGRRHLSFTARPHPPDQAHRGAAG